MRRQEGIDFYPMSVDMVDDDKVFDLMMRIGEGSLYSEGSYCAYGRLMELYAQIYREGYALEIDDRKIQRIAYRLGFGEDREAALEFIGTCVACGLFDEGLWSGHRVLTSRGVQRRYATAKKTAASRMRGPWVLGDGQEGPSEPSESSGNATSPEISEISGDRPESPEKPVDKIRLDKIREERTEAVAGGMAGALPCLAVPAEGSSVFIDTSGSPHRTALGAIADSYRAACGRDPARFISNFKGRCPASCRGDPSRADECFQLAMRAIERFDRSKCSDPWPLCKAILDEERGTA